MSKVFIIIVNYNSWHDTLECLESLKKITYPNFSILIIDNNSTDNSLRKLNEYKQKRHNSLFIIHNSKNLGFAGADNIGIKKALEKKADYVLLLNPDTIVEPDFLDKLVETAEKSKQQGKLAFFGPRIYLKTENSKLKTPQIYSNGGIINWSQTKGTLKDYGKSASEVKETEPFETDYVSGTSVLISKELIEKVGLMREDYFLYYEDTDWAIRARKQGIASVIVPQSIIWHKMSTSTLGGSPDYFKRSDLPAEASAQAGKQGSPSIISERRAILELMRGSYIYYHVRNGLYCGWRNGNVLQKIAVLGLTKWIFIKQPLKFLIPSLTSGASVLRRQSRKWAKPVMKAVIDFWRGKTGKIK